MLTPESTFLVVNQQIMERDTYVLAFMFQALLSQWSLVYALTFKELSDSNRKGR